MTEQTSKIVLTFLMWCTEAYLLVSDLSSRLASRLFHWWSHSYNSWTRTCELSYHIALWLKQLSQKSFSREFFFRISVDRQTIIDGETYKYDIYFCFFFLVHSPMVRTTNECPINFTRKRSRLESSTFTIFSDRRQKVYGVEWRWIELWSRTKWYRTWSICNSIYQ